LRFLRIISVESMNLPSKSITGMNRMGSSLELVGNGRSRTIKNGNSQSVIIFRDSNVKFMLEYILVTYHGFRGLPGAV
jgi:hypothetical protein